jgi:glycosyltransferase involved in cell wall biosynthesis
VSPRVLYTAFDVVPSPKGASRHITAFTQALSQAGYQVTLFTVGCNGLPEREAYAGAEILRWPSEEQNYLRRAQGFGDAVWEHLRDRQGGYDVAHFRDLWSGSAALEARGSLGYSYRTLYEVNGLASVELKYMYPDLRGGDLPDRLRQQESKLLRHADQVVCVSRVTAIYLKSMGAKADKLSIIRNGVDAGQFYPDAPLSANPPILVYLGTLAPWQGLDCLLRAMPLILEAYPEAQLHLVGPYKRAQHKELLKLAGKLSLPAEQINITGPVAPEEAADWLAKATVCLAPLAWNDRNVSQGCCPIKLLEYAAAGRPIVAADLPVARELLREGECLFTQPGDPADLARAVIRLLEDLPAAQAMGARAARSVRRRYTWQRAGEELIKIYQRDSSLTN